MPPLCHLLDQPRAITLASSGALTVGTELLTENQVPLLVVRQPAGLVPRVTDDQEGHEDTATKGHDTFDQEEPSKSRGITGSAKIL